MDTKNTDTMTLITAGTVTQMAGLIEPNLRVEAGGAVTLDHPENDVDVLSANAPVGGSHFRFADRDDLTVGTVDTVTGVAVNGGLSIYAGGGVTQIIGSAITSNGGAISIFAGGDIKLTLLDARVSGSSDLLNAGDVFVTSMNGNILDNDFGTVDGSSGAPDFDVVGAHITLGAKEVGSSSSEGQIDYLQNPSDVVANRGNLPVGDVPLYLSGSPDVAGQNQSSQSQNPIEYAGVMVPNGVVTVKVAPEVVLVKAKEPPKCDDMILDKLRAQRAWFEKENERLRAENDKLRGENVRIKNEKKRLENLFPTALLHFDASHVSNATEDSNSLLGEQEDHLIHTEETASISPEEMQVLSECEDLALAKLLEQRQSLLKENSDLRAENNNLNHENIELRVANDNLKKEEKLMLQKIFESVFFDFDRSNIRKDAAEILDNQARWLKENSLVRIEIGGFTDERGGDEYNKKLGERRAKAVQNYLARLGIEPERIGTKSYGKSERVCFVNDSACHQRNRRGRLSVIR
jgi:outer membrane protein OmpA-like peptidoglycan-associated protein